MARIQAGPITAEDPSGPIAPPFAAAWAALTYALCALSLAYPALAGQFLVNSNSDQYLAGYSFREFAAHTLKATGGFPQWNPYIFDGLPFVGAMHGDIFYPTFLLRLVLPTDVAMTWGMILHFFLCGLATYWFLRQAGRFSFFAALVGGVAYMMGGFVSSLLSAGHDGKLFVSALLPVALLVVTWGVRDGRRWAWGVLALVVGLAVLSPHPQLLQYLLLAAGAWALFLAFGGLGPEKLDRDVAIRRLALALGAVLVGGAIGAIQYLPVSEYASWSPRAGGREYDYATSFSFPLEELINTYLPQFSGILESYWGRNGIHFHSEYVGAAVLVLASAALSGGWTAARKRLLWFWTGVGVVSLLWALGGSTPFFQVVYAIVPGTKFMRAPSTMFYVTTFAIAVFAAAGTERLLAGKLSTRFAYGWLIGGAVVTLFALLGGLTVLAQNLAPTPDRVELAASGLPAVRLGALRSLAFLTLVCGTILLLARGRISPLLAGWSLAAVCAADLWSIERLYWGFLPAASKIYASDPTIEFVKKVSQPIRVIALGFPELPMAPHDPFLTGDALMAHGVRVSLLGYHGNELGRFQQLAGKDRGYEQLANPTFWALTNSEFLLANTDTLPFKGATRVLGPVMNAAGSKVSLFLLPGEHPFAWVAPAIMKYPDASVLDALHSPNFPVRSVALFEPSAKVEGIQASALPAPLALATHVDRYEPGHIEVTLSEPAPKGSALVVSENYYPGWSATVDGKRAEVDRADYVLIGVPLPEGAKSVVLTFRSAAFETGKQLTLAALGLAILAALAGLFPRAPQPGGTRAPETNAGRSSAEQEEA